MTKKEPKDKRIQDILDAAVAEFVDKGYENTSMESIAARAGLTKGGLYYHFTGKDDILIMANERFMEPILAFFAEAMANPSAAAGLASYINNFLRYWTGHPRELTFIFLSMTKTLSNSRLMEAYQGYAPQMIGFFNGLYRKGADAGEFIEREYGEVSLTLMAALDGIAGYLAMDTTLVLDDVIEGFRSVYIGQFRMK